MKQQDRLRIQIVGGESYAPSPFMWRKSLNDDDNEAYVND